MLIKEREKITKGLTEILRIADKGSFVEIGARAIDKETDIYSPEVVYGSDGVVTGYATVDGRAVFVFCQDEDVMGGTVGFVHAEKIRRIYRMAQKAGTPVIGILNSTGFRVEEAADGLEAFAALYREALKAREKILQIIIKNRDCVGSMATLAESADFVVENGKDNAEMIRQLLDILPSSKKSEQERGDIKDDLNRLCAGIGEKTGNALDIIREISDENFMLEYKPNTGRKTITAFIRLAGRTVGAIAAGRTGTEDAVMDIEGTEKAAQFVKICSRLNIGILTTGCNHGVEASDAKNPHMIGALCSLAENMASADVPKVSLLPGECAGLGYMLMGSKAFAMDVVFAWPNAKVTMIDPRQAVEIIHPGIKPADVLETAGEYEQRRCNVDFLLERGYADKVIAPEESRKYLIGAFETFYGAY